MNIRQVVLIVWIVLAAGPTSAQQASDPTAWAQQFFGTLMSRGVEPAVTMLNEETALGRMRKTLAPTIREAVNAQIRSAGTMINYELTKESKLGSRTVRLAYIVNHLCGATQYRLHFYRTDRGWDLIGMQIEGDILKMDFN